MNQLIDYFVILGDDGIIFPKMIKTSPAVRLCVGRMTHLNPFLAAGL